LITQTHRLQQPAILRRDMAGRQFSVTPFLVLRLLLIGIAVYAYVAGRPANADVVSAQYEARAATVVGTPFGLTVPLNTTITGFITYDTSTPDTDPSANNGNYPHASGGAFRANVLGTLISGSATPDYQVSVTDTFRIWDGPRTSGRQGGIMSINGSADSDITMFMAVTPKDKSLLATDQLVNPFFDFDFGFLGDPHTFTIGDDAGTILMQIDNFSAIPEPSTFILAALGLLSPCMTRRRRRR
jgi:hypothetical protein